MSIVSDDRVSRHPAEVHRLVDDRRLVVRISCRAGGGSHSGRALQRRGDRLRLDAAQRRAQAVLAREINPYETPFNPFMPTSAYALAASRHMHEFGTTREQLAEVAVAARKWAQLNPVAWEKKPLTVEDVLKSRMISLSASRCATAASSPTAAARS